MKWLMNKKAAAVVICLLLVACAGPSGQQATEIDEDELARAVKEVREQLDGAMRAEDVDAYLSFYMEDAVWLPPHAEEYVGKAAARQKLESFFRSVDVEGDSTVEEQLVMGPNWIGERGQFSVLLSPKQGDAEPVLWCTLGGDSCSHWVSRCGSTLSTSWCLFSWRSSESIGNHHVRTVLGRDTNHGFQLPAARLGVL